MSRALALILGVSLGCSTPVHVEDHSSRGAPPLRKLALAPFSVGVPLAEADLGDLTPEEVAGLVTSRVLESLTLWTDFEVVPPLEVNQLLMTRGPIDMPRTPPEMGDFLARSFRIQAVLYGTVRRFVPRIGGRNAARRPAAVWFELELRMPDGSLLWSGTYDEIQRPLSDDPASFSRAMSRSFRFVSAEELVRYGADELVQRMPEPSD